MNVNFDLWQAVHRNTLPFMHVFMNVSLDGRLAEQAFCFLIVQAILP